MTEPGLRVIGIIRTAHEALEHTPIQSSLNRGEQGIIEFDRRYVDGLEGLDGFTHAWLITLLASPNEPWPEPALRQVPFLLQRQPREMGIFATRGPRRPNPFGLSLVRLRSIEGSTIRFDGVDMLDRTPLLDIKPYFTDVDRPDGEVRCGWFDTVTIGESVTPASLRPPEDQAR